MEIYRKIELKKQNQKIAKSIRRQSVEYLIRLLQENACNPILSIIEMASDPEVPLKFRFRANELLYRSLISHKSSIEFENTLDDELKETLKRNMLELESKNKKDF